MKYWIILSTEWKLEDVQAALNVIISLLCVGAVFTSARYFWHSSARRVSRSDQVPISSLLSFTTLGEALDVIILLKSRLFHASHARLAVQCLLVIVFSFSAIFAGPISRFSTRVGQTYSVRPVNGLLASKSYNCEIDNYIRWHEIFSALDKADFPHDQLLDFLPDLNQDYVYRSDDWNSTFSARCESTNVTRVHLTATGNYTNTTYYLYDEIPELVDLFSPRFRENGSNFWTSYTGTRIPKDDIWSSLAMFQYAELRPDDDWDSADPTERMSISIVAIAMKDAPSFDMTPLDDFDYLFGVGDIPDAWYSKVECDLTRSRPITDKNQWEASVDLSNTCDVAGELTTFFAPSMMRAQGDHSTQFNVPSGDDLFRFYQSWSVAKDTHYPTSAMRDLHMRLKTVELSTIFLAVVSLVTLIVLVGCVHCLIAHFLYKGIYSRIPETKVDWLLQSLREAEGKEVNDMATSREEKGGAFNAPGYKSRVVSNAAAASSSSDDDADVDGEYQPYNPTLRRMPWEQAHYILVPQAPSVGGTAGEAENLHLDGSLAATNSVPRTAVMGSIRMPTTPRTSTFGAPTSATYQTAGSNQKRTPSILSPGAKRTR